MSRRALLLVSRVAGWLIVPLYIAGAGAYYLLTISAGFWDDDTVVDNVTGVMLGVGFGAFAVVGALLVVRRPANAIGWILAAIGLMVSIFNAGGGYATFVVATRGRPDALAVLGAWVANCYWFLMLALALIYLPMLFPDGRLLSRRWLPVAVIGGISTLGIVLPGALVDNLPVNELPGKGISNPIGIEGLGKIEDLPMFGVIEALFLVAAVGAVASVAVRFRRSRGVERQQMKLFAYVIVVLIGGSVLAGGISDTHLPRRASALPEGLIPHLEQLMRGEEVAKRPYTNPPPIPSGGRSPYRPHDPFSRNCRVSPPASLGSTCRALSPSRRVGSRS